LSLLARESRAEQAEREVVLTHHEAFTPRFWFSTFTTE